MMLAESPTGHESPLFYQNEGARNKRLADVKRGTDYYKKLDNIAEAQWKANVPTFPAVPRKMSVLPKITTSVLSDPDTEARRSMFNMTSTPRQSISMMSGAASTVTGYTGATNSQMSLPSHISRIIHHRPSVLDSPHELTPREPKVDPNFNPWGTSYSPLDDQTKLTAEDMRPREMPFQYRDSRKIVMKPVPRKSMPMSRVAAHERQRHQRTVTNFRSRNGTIRIIKPLEPLPEIEKYHKNIKHETFDIENIEREKTFMMLERIDRILHPNKKSPRTLLGSSEEEIPGTSESSVTLPDEVKDTRDTHIVNIVDSSRRPSKSPRSISPRITPRMDHSSRSKGRNSRNERPKRPRIRFHNDPFKPRPPKTMADVLQSLEISKEDTDIKCQSWIDKCI
ncbi:uncharacterized protein LOC132718461 [Ruditapes philippinarum]|uniref:uncharacterized protein LOC132718461 n=1 Tax=Ruditapes philippinarum TaxID=129788 RepID=UPI00295BA06E|nr:uncharacterized protein LOC132718461 [Ruditapes philippinarum]XP_060558143.1 uncharacterized protein LOC132718461 [Ruditapes philippinarum]XP_060558144.1 uncharacterized protein LOC132718461 [Ruditapes philippinarum]